MADEATLADILAGSGHSASPEVDQFERLAGNAHAYRLDKGRADRAAINRSTSLWALAELSRRVEASLQAGGVDPRRFAAMLGLQSGVRQSFAPAASESNPQRPPALDVDLAGALQEYLSALPPSEPVSLEHLAIAILESAARNSSAGMLPQRLAELGIDYTRTLDQLKGAVGSDEPPTEVGFSQSVGIARDTLGDDTSVTAAGLAAEVQHLHPEYANRAFGAIALRVDRGPRRRVGEWLGLVRQLYDPEELRTTGRKVINGQLTVLGLAELDGSLEEDLSRGGVLESWRGTVGPLPRRISTDRTDWTDDAPAKEEDDMLGRTYLAEVLAKRLRTMITPGRSFLVHLDGPWGAGKSTLLTFLEAELRAPSEAGDQAFLIAEVNAWREEQVGVQWWTLHHSLRRAIERDARNVSRWRGAGAWLRNRWQMAMARRSLVVTIVLALVLILAGGAFLLFGNLDDRNETADFWGKTLSLVAAGVAGIVAVYRFFVPTSRDSANELVAKSANPMGDVRRLFARTLEQASKPVVFVIDDLDRCDSKYVVKFLQVLQTLVRDPLRTPRMPAGPFAIVAADGGWIRSSYEQEYRDLPVNAIPGRPLGYQFLEKIFQLRVRLPSISESAKQGYYESLLRSPVATDVVNKGSGQLVDEIKQEIKHAKTGDDLSRAIGRADGVADLKDRMDLLGAAALQSAEPALRAEARHLLGQFGRFLEPNPRNIKLFVNTYGMLQALLALEGTPGSTTRLARWTIVEIRWPELADYLRAHPDDLDQSAGETVPTAIKLLLADGEISAVLGDVEWPAFSPDDVRACTGATPFTGTDPRADARG